MRGLLALVGCENEVDQREVGRMNIAINGDCMEVMRQYPDKYFDLAVVDPPYGDLPKGGYMNGTGGGLAKQVKYHDAIW
jgi:DNA modification methylase